VADGGASSCDPHRRRAFFGKATRETQVVSQSLHYLCFLLFICSIAHSVIAG
jgi:hypothetical protein